jgi:glyoxalase family protein
MSSPILGLHHVTATVDAAQPDLDFFRGGLGLRLVKRTVNFDNHNVYHFYYGTEVGAPGTIWTTFPYKGWGVPVGSKGAGQIVATTFSVPGSALDFWRMRLANRDVVIEDLAPRFGEEGLVFQDPSGLVVELVAGPDDRPPWPSAGVGAESAVRGLHSVTLLIRSPARSLELLTGPLGFEVVDQDGRRTRLGIRGRGAGKTIDIVEAPEAPAAVNGIGTVHHVALAISSDEEQLRLREELLRMGLQVTEVRDRTYFRSIYFREPGGVLLEVATIKPGFTFDEELPCLGEDLKLPPWEEPHRAQIEARLPAISS